MILIFRDRVVASIFPGYGAYFFSFCQSMMRRRRRRLANWCLTAPEICSAPWYLVVSLARSYRKQIGHIPLWSMPLNLLRQYHRRCLRRLWRSRLAAASKTRTVEHPPRAVCSRETRPTCPPTAGHSRPGAPEAKPFQIRLSLFQFKTLCNDW